MSTSVAVTDAANYLKIAGASIYAFDYIQTLPAEIRLSEAKGFLEILFGMLAYVSGHGGHSFVASGRVFDDIYREVVLAAVASHGVFIFRTYAICQRNRKVLYFLIVFGGLLSAAEIISPVVVPRNSKLGSTGNCISDLTNGSTSWIQYMCQVLFDVVILGITMDTLFRGTKMKLVTRSEFTKIFWESQVMYFIAVTVSNIINLVFFVVYNHSSESTMFATLGMAITAIFSSHVILDLHEASHRGQSYSTSGQIANPNHANGVHTTTYRNGEIVDRQFRVVTADDREVKTNAYRMDNIEAGGIHVQREVVAMSDDQISLNSWERQNPDVKKVTAI
ncbi:hypothetical protein H0H92_005567 [Tricholoma furcatifolium]|nr:hypothetical protein H0H92_005567 [Tricholoma furcatifolium]